MTVAETITALVRKHVDPDFVPCDDVNWASDLGMDSLERIDLVLSLEAAFGIEIPDADAEKLETFGATVAYVERLRAR